MAEKLNISIKALSELIAYKKESLNHKIGYSKEWEEYLAKTNREIIDLEREIQGLETGIQILERGK